MSKASDEMVNKICKELASEVIKRQDDPDYRSIMDRDECTRKLATITSRDRWEMDEIMEKKIDQYVRSGRALNNLR